MQTEMAILESCNRNFVGWFRRLQFENLFLEACIASYHIWMQPVSISKIPLRRLFDFVSWHAAAV